MSTAEYALLPPAPAALHRPDLHQLPDLHRPDLHRPDFQRPPDLGCPDQRRSPESHRPDLCPPPDRTRPDFHRPDLARADLARADLARADLARADLARADLARADLARADLARPGLALPALRRPDLRRLDRRGRVGLGVAAAVAVLVNVGVGWTYRSVTAAPATGAPAVEMTLPGRSGDGLPVRLGPTGDLTVTVTNLGSFPLRIAELRPGGPVTVDAGHRRAGCRVTGVAVSAAVLPVSWEVSGRTVGVFTVPDGVRLPADRDPACRGAVFSVPVRALGTGAQS